MVCRYQNTLHIICGRRADFQFDIQGFQRTFAQSDDRMIAFGRVAGIDTAQMPSGSEQPSRQAEQPA